MLRCRLISNESKKDKSRQIRRSIHRHHVGDSGIAAVAEWHDISATFKDTNLDGVRQSGEAALAGEIIYVDANSNGKLDAGEKFTTSNSAGNYSLAGLAAGTYRLRALPPAGWRYDWTGPAGFFYDVTVTATSTVTGKNFGNTTSSIIGLVFNDLDANTAKSSTEPVLSGRTFFLDTNHNGKLDAGEITTKSNANGMYAFGPLPAGNYQVRELLARGLAHHANRRRRVHLRPFHRSRLPRRLRQHHASQIIRRCVPRSGWRWRNGQ